MAYSVKDKVFLITGGASGLGAGMTRAFVEEGAKHVSILDVANDAGKALETELNNKHGKNKTKFIKCDVTDDELLFKAYETAIAAHGPIDVVINNAGIMNDSPKLYKKEILLNVAALVTSTLKAIEIMRKDKGGKGGTVINISSIAGLAISPLLPIYFATKSAVLHFSSCIGMEPQYSRTGVRVLTVCFSATNTALIDKDNFASFDDPSTEEFTKAMAAVQVQKPESAVRGVVDAFKNGESGSTWLAAHDNPTKNITQDVNDAYAILSNTFK